ncbi:MAG: hypothetical protein ACRDL2_15920 [Gaiellaceae bacterium]
MRLFALINEELRTSALPTPESGEDEEIFTDRHVLPIVQTVVQRTDVRGLLVGGHHTGINRPVRYLSLDFHPDVLVIHHGERCIAYEVKFLAGGDRSGAFSKAIGQATIYGMYGYEASAALLLDVAGRLTPSHIAHVGRGTSGPSRFAVIARTAHRKHFRAGAVAYAER